MKMGQFVSGSAVLIAGWLVLTFMHEVSPQQYPQQHRSTPVHAANHEPAKAAKAVALPRSSRNDAVPVLVATSAE
ncbi:MAG: hypothetical protein WCJ66_16160 [Verrucomicrobiota bacterium]